MTSFETIFSTTVGKPLQLNEPLAKYTTIGIGGPAQYFFSAASAEELQKAVLLAYQHQIPVMVLGGGSNVVIADQGISGLVVRNQIKTFEIFDATAVDGDKKPTPTAVSPRLEQYKQLSPYQVDSLIPSFSASDEAIFVRIGAGWKMNDLILHTFKHSLTGLEWFGGIPGSVGGAIYMNMHGGTFFWSQFVESVRVLTAEGQEKTYTAQDLAFDYDYSILHETKELLVDAVVMLFKGDVAQAQKIFKYWSVKKIQNQPQRSAGCVFQNLTPEQKTKAGLSTSSIGYMIDQVLGLGGYQVGGVRVSPQHAAFIENVGGATAADVLKLVQYIEEQVKTKFGIELKREIEFLGSV